MRTLMGVLVGLLSLTGAIPVYDLSKTEVVARHYTETWFADVKEKARCGTLLRGLAGSDFKYAIEHGTTIDDALRKEKCLDVYSYIYGRSTLPIAPAIPRLDSSSVDLVGSYLFVYINTFENEGDDLVAKIDKLDTKSLDAVKTVVIDVRGNPGGYISTLHRLLDQSFSPRAGVRYLEPKGKVTYGTHYMTSRTGILAGRAIRILTDSDTASSSEWMIETLCYEWYTDKQMCTTLGSKTTGKSVLQCIWNGEIQIKLTCGEWFLAERGETKKDQSRAPQRIQGVGIEPDMPMSFDCDRFSYSCIAKQLAEAGL